MSLWRQLQSPSTEGNRRFHCVLDEVREVVEEVDARVLFEVADGNGVLAKMVFVTRNTIVLMLHVEANGGVNTVLYLEKSHVVVLGYGHLLRGHVDGVCVDIVERPTLYHIERVGKRFVAAKRLYFIFESRPEILVETCDLGAHIAHVEGLVVGFARIKTVV